MTFINFFNPNDFIGQAVWALLLLSLLTAPMGCFMVWRKLSYFGATLAHSALLGAILGLLMGVGVLAGVISFTVILGVLLSFWLNHRLLAGDTILGMIAHLSLAVGVIAISLMDNLRIDLMVYLFGDVLAISDTMFHSLAICALLGVVLIALFWRGFVNLCVQRDIAAVEGYQTTALELIFILVLSMTIALGMLSIGILLIVAILIIPAATARLFSRSLKQMVFIAWLVSILSVLLGMLMAYQLDFPAGPTVVVCAGGIFVVANVVKLVGTK